MAEELLFTGVCRFSAQSALVRWASPGHIPMLFQVGLPQPAVPSFCAFRPGISKEVVREHAYMYKGKRRTALQGYWLWSKTDQNRVLFWGWRLASLPYGFVHIQRGFWVFIGVQWGFWSMASCLKIRWPHRSCLGGRGAENWALCFWLRFFLVARRWRGLPWQTSKIFESRLGTLGLQLPLKRLLFQSFSLQLQLCTEALFNILKKLQLSITYRSCPPNSAASCSRAWSHEAKVRPCHDSSFIRESAEMRLHCLEEGLGRPPTTWWLVVGVTKRDLQTTPPPNRHHGFCSFCSKCCCGDLMRQDLCWASEILVFGLCFEFTEVAQGHFSWSRSNHRSSKSSKRCKRSDDLPGRR